MGKIIEAMTPDTYKFWCPGCNKGHCVSSSWQIDLSTDTLSPSVLAYSRNYLINPDLEGDALTAPENVGTTPQCHSFVRNGRIEFLSDSTHALAGQTVDLPEWPVH